MASMLCVCQTAGAGAGGRAGCGCDAFVGWLVTVYLEAGKRTARRDVSALECSGNCG